MRVKSMERTRQALEKLQLRIAAGKLKGCDRAGARDYAAFLGFFSLDPS